MNALTFKQKIEDHTITREDFLAFFEAIPDIDWTVDQFRNFNGQQCARGFVLEAADEDADELLCNWFPNTVLVNNGREYSKDGVFSSPSFERQKGAKKRVIRYIRLIIARTRKISKGAEQ